VNWRGPARQGGFLLALAVFGLVPGEGAPAPPPPVREKKAEAEPRAELPKGRVGVSTALAFLTDITGLPVFTAYKPQGSLDFSGREGVRYTAPEIIDIIAAQLRRHHHEYLLIRGNRSFSIVPAEEASLPDGSLRFGTLASGIDYAAYLRNCRRD